ncbi:O-methyltransferase [Parachitinimonas caeni]|uniref:O-methyltransferase n=1 Tax=Parachitinimonas caeni TaxID=3031301 RepID=A0ABT7E0Z1_9NEIS|nr:O-methyltransferase [Parachitinimonas caeni]MDK2125983.1 O-methyltransferase [Parachitinimonas caeni]
MAISLNDFLAELYGFGQQNDREHTVRHERMLNITPETGAFLELLIRSSRPEQILEIGTSNGYSTIWLAKAAMAIGARLTTVECAEDKLALAQANFAECGLTGAIEVIHADAGAYLADLADGSIDFLFLDSERSEYSSWWPHLDRVLSRQGLLVVDNAISHQTELQSFMAAISADERFITSLIPIGNGEFTALKISQLALA